MKKIIIALAAVIILGAGVFFLISYRGQNQNQEQSVLKKTYNISKEYLSTAPDLPH